MLLECSTGTSNVDHGTVDNGFARYFFLSSQSHYYSTWYLVLVGLLSEVYIS